MTHEFGGQHTELKLSIVQQYLKAFATALRPQFRELWYIDAFAGTGRRTSRSVFMDGEIFEERIVEVVEIRKGSASLALEIKPAFDKVVFIEQNSRYCEELNKLRNDHPTRDISIINDDANHAIKRLLRADGWSSARGVLFLDPYGMEVEWTTLEAIAATKAIDVWFLFPLAGLFRQATRRLTNIDPHKRAALNKMFGSDRWEQDLYTAESSDQFSLFDADPERLRTAGVKDLENYVHQRLSSIFPKVLKPLALPVDAKPQRFSLFLCISNPEPKAIGLATKLGNHILKGSSS